MSDFISQTFSANLSRIWLFLGSEKLAKLRNARVAVFGLGAVGSFATEALARSGIGYLRLVDFDVVKPSNINRQLYALHSTIGKSKIELAKQRVLDISPEIIVETHNMLYCSQNKEHMLDGHLDFIVDAIDSVNPKFGLIQCAVENKIPIVSAMGAACKFDPSQIRCTDISQVQGCNLCHHVRRRLHRVGIYSGVTVIWSAEPSIIQTRVLPDGMEEVTFERGRPRIPLPSMIFVPATIGILAAQHVVKSILEIV